MLPTRSTRWSLTLLVLVGFVAVSAARAQQPAEKPADEQAKPDAAKTGEQQDKPAAPADDRQEIMVRVIEVTGDVKHAPLDSQEYKPCKLDDEYPPRTKIITGVRSSIKLQIGDEEPYTCMLIEAVGKTILSEAFKTADTKKVRVGVGYGRIRAGVAEGGLKSDFTVDSPVATLSKRGTWGFTLFYERDTDHFEIGLTEYGLVEAINELLGKRRVVKPREMVTQAMRRWLDQAPFDRNVPVPDVLGQGKIDVAFNRIKQSGLGVLQPGQGEAVLIDLSNASARTSFADLLGRTLPMTPLRGADAGARLRAEGFFGTGRGDELINVLIEANNPLVQRGLTKPGNYKFRRAALEGWMREYKKGR